MDPRKAVGHEAIRCLVCGKAYKTLKRHLRNAHDMSPRDYRAAFDLAKDYPLIAPSLSEQRAKVAKEHNLGERLACQQEAAERWEIGASRPQTRHGIEE